MITLTCDNCGKQYEMPKARGLRTYCSRPCRFAGQNGAENPNWRGGQEARSRSARRRLSPTEVTSRLSYNPDTGIFRWISANEYRRVQPGDIAGWRTNHGYCRIKLDGVDYSAHRLAFVVQLGEWPSGKVDHRNGVRDDNRWANLRQVSDTQNAQNKAIQKTNTSGVSGVSFNKRQQKWVARITVDGQRFSLGVFESLEKAAAARVAAEVIHFGEFRRLAS